MAHCQTGTCQLVGLCVISGAVVTGVAPTMSFEIWLSFTLLVFLLVLTPGPSILIGMSHALRYGARPTLMTALGDVTANMIQMVIAAVGLGADRVVGFLVVVGFLEGGRGHSCHCPCSCWVDRGFWGIGRGGW